MLARFQQCRLGIAKAAVTFNFLRKWNFFQTKWNLWKNKHSDNIYSLMVWKSVETRKILFQAGWGLSLVWLISANLDVRVFNLRTKWRTWLPIDASEEKAIWKCHIWAHISDNNVLCLLMNKLTRSLLFLPRFLIQLEASLPQSPCSPRTWLLCPLFSGFWWGHLGRVIKWK